LFDLARATGWKPRRRARPKAAAAPSSEGPPVAAPAGGAGGGGGDDGDSPLGYEDGKPRRFPFLTGGDFPKPRGIRENVYYALKFDRVLAGLVAFNEFTELHESTRKTPWGSGPGDWQTIDDLHLANWLARKYGMTIGSVDVIQQAIDMAARDNPIHPLRDWLRSLKHDGVLRLNKWLADFVGAADNEYTQLAGRMFLIGMVARVMKPGCKMDYALILQGRQGVGKSSAFRALAQPWFSDTPFRIGDKDALMAVQGVWLYEFSELDSLAKSEETAIKAFITSVEDRFRPPYGTRMVNVRRRVVLGGTTNGEEFLRDATGGRRFWPIKVGEINTEGIAAMRDQLFAEAVAAFDAGARWYPSREEEGKWFQPEQDRWKLVDVWADFLRVYVNSRSIRDQDEDGDAIEEMDRERNYEREFFSTQELMVRALKIDPSRIDSAKQMQRRIAQCMTELGFHAGKRVIGGKEKRGYIRNAPAAAPPEQQSTNTPAGDAPAPADDPDALARQSLAQGEVAL
jgi:predicted P-loop ATPase